MTRLDRDLEFVEAMASELKSYLLGKELFRPLRGDGGVLPRGTLGGLLLRLHRLAAMQRQLSPPQLSRYRDLHPFISQELAAWQVQVEEKGEREIRSRLDNWSSYVEELQSDPARYAPDYRQQVEGRTVLHLLRQYLGPGVGGAGVTNRLIVLDKALREVTEAADFVLDADQAEAFPPSPFWWLYLAPLINPAPNGR